MPPAGATVIKEFKGAPDGQPRVRVFKPGETVTGDLAAVAVRQGWAELADASSAKADPEAGNLTALTVAQLQALAQEQGIDLGEASRKADIIAAIEAAQTAQPAG